MSQSLFSTRPRLAPPTETPLPIVTITKDALDSFRCNVEGFLDDFEKEISFSEVLVWNDSIREVEMNIKAHDLTIHQQEMEVTVEIPDKYSQVKRHHFGIGGYFEEHEAIAWTEEKYDECGERIMKVKRMKEEKRSFSFRDDITRTVTARKEIKYKNEFSLFR